MSVRSTGPATGPVPEAIPGPAGPTGPQGIQGVPGAIGLTGAKGETGATGSTGPQGGVGATGATGSVGATGPQGPIGNTGAQGPQGIAGVAGVAGAIGATGPAGAPGLTLIGNVTVSETLLVSLSLGMKRKTYTLTGVGASDRLLAVPNGVPTTGCEVVNAYPAGTNSVSVGYYTPALGIAATYTIPVSVYRVS